MKIKIAILLLLCLSTLQANAQKVYKERGQIILDCGSESDFPEASSSNSTKVIEGTPSNVESLSSDNNEEGTINATVYEKLEIATIDGAGLKDWAAAYSECVAKGAGWRLPTLREITMISVFRNAICSSEMGGTKFQSGEYWCLTEVYSTLGITCLFPDDPASGGGMTNHRLKIDSAYFRCVKEIR